MSRPGSLAGATLVALALLAPPARAQCAMCKATLQASEEGRRVSRELNQAILACAGVLFRRRIGAFLKSRLRR
jgi:hypothetical protein